jgi:putative transposase
VQDVEVELRREAARRRLAGESPRAIAIDLGRTRQWVAKWAARYDPVDAGWAQGRSRAPRRVAGRADAGVEKLVREVRARLEENPWAQVGAPAVAWELEKLGAFVPPLRTIERILGRAGATRRQRPGRRASKGIPYPSPAAGRPGELVQVDLVGPRHLDGGVRFHALNQIDVASHQAGIEIVENRGDRLVVAALHALWTRHGVPRRVQFDNGGPFVSPTGIGEVVRVCLHQGATPVFIPPREPWRNGTIAFQRHLRQALLSPGTFRWPRAPRRASRRVRALPQHPAPLPRNSRRTPDETPQAAPRTPRAIDELPAGWPTAGRVEFIRFIRSATNSAYSAARSRSRTPAPTNT